jgi:hypothetical protein
MTSDYAVNGYSVNGIQTFMNARSNYLGSIPEFTNSQPVLHDAARIYDNGARFTVQADDADHVFLFYRLKSEEHRSYTMVEMTLSGNEYGITLPIFTDTLDYYYYAENSNIGAFLPARASKEFYRVPINESMGINDQSKNDNIVYYSKYTQSIQFILTEPSEMIHIYSIGGQLLKSLTPTDLHFDVSTETIAPQMVIVQITQNKSIKTKKIVIL